MRELKVMVYERDEIKLELDQIKLVFKVKALKDDQVLSEFISDDRETIKIVEIKDKHAAVKPKAKK
jgi:hypothetical protein